MAYKRHHEVKIYVSAGSVMCNLAKDFFRAADIDFDEIIVSPFSDSEKELLEVSGDNKTPTVDFDGRIIVGYQPDVYEIMVKADEKK